jgi:hypothetical protein
VSSDKRLEFDRLLKDATGGNSMWSWRGPSIASAVRRKTSWPFSEIFMRKALASICTSRVSTPRHLFQMMGVFAEFERAMIQERVAAGLAKARAKGKRLGRLRVSLSVECAIQDARTGGKSQQAIARELRVGVGTVRRVLGLNAPKV